MQEFLYSFALRALRNKHTTGAGLVYGAAWAFESIAPIWFPEAKEKIVATADQLRKACFMYATIMGADSPKVLTPTQQEVKDHPVESLTI